MPNSADFISVISQASSFSWQDISALGTYKASPVARTRGSIHMPPGEERRVLFNWNSTKEWSASNNTLSILGRHTTRSLGGIGTINEPASVGTSITDVNGYYLWFRVASVTALEDGIVQVNGDQHYADGTTDGAKQTNSEQIVIDATTAKTYRSAKCYVGTPDLVGNQPGVGTMIIGLGAGGIVEPWSHGGMVKVLEGFVAEFRPSSSTWRFDVEIYKFAPGTAGTNGLITLFTKTFRNTDAVPRAQNGVSGRIFHTEMNSVIDPDAKEGFVMRLNMNAIDFVDFWASFYRH